MSYHILIVEDDPDSLRAYVRALRGVQGWNIHTADCLAAARSTLRDLDAHEIHCALIILDVNLPDSLGLAGIVNLRQFVKEVSEGTPPVAIVAVTGVEAADLRTEVLSWGVKNYHVKGTLSLALLRTLVQEALEGGDDSVN